MPDDNVSGLSAALEDVWNGGKIDLIGNYYHDDFQGHFPEPFVIHGAAELAEVVTSLKTSFPDFHEVVLETIAAEDKVIARYTISGTQQADFQGQQSQGKRFEVASIDIYRFSDGKVAEQWGVMDFHSMYRQLGWTV